MHAPVPNDVFLFGAFRLDRRAGGLFTHDVTGGSSPVAIGPRALDVLSALVVRHGELVTKDEIMRAVWPGITVEEHNLTVQISALRRVLDENRAGESCIQTVSGRGYRFVSTVMRAEGQPDPGPVPIADAMTLPKVPAQSRRSRLRWLGTGLGGIVVAVLAIAVGWQGGWFAGQPALPRLSIVVLPFQNLSDDPKDDYLADGLTDDLTNDLSHIPGAFVIASQSAYTYKGKPKDVRKIGQELGVRYVLGGSVRRIGSILRVNAQLTSSDTGAHLWSDRFDEQITELAAGQEQIVTRLYVLGIRMLDIETARSLYERPTNPDAFDLILRARAVRNLPPNPQRTREALALYEHALSSDPSSANAMANIAYYLLDSTTTGLGISFEDMRRAERLLAQARTIAPNSAEVLNYFVYWLSLTGRCQEVIEAAEQAIHMDPNQGTGVYNELGKCKTQTGHAEDVQATADRRNPNSGSRFRRYNRMAFASLMLGRDQDAITFYRRSLAMNPAEGGNQRVYRELAAAYARMGQHSEAKQALAEADRRWPHDTVRSWAPEMLTSSVYIEQFRRFQDALRLAGERDHADEDADFGVPADIVLHDESAGRTPTSAPGALTIRTADLSRFLAQASPIVIDTMLNSWGRSIPGAVGLKFVGLGGNVTDSAQDRLRTKMRTLASSDPDRPIVAIGFNSERFDGRNLALRLVALGYTQVYWYRGGREAWEVANLPETAVNAEEW